MAFMATVFTARWVILQGPSCLLNYCSGFPFRSAWSLSPMAATILYPAASLGSRPSFSRPVASIPQRRCIIQHRFSSVSERACVSTMPTFFSKEKKTEKPIIVIDNYDSFTYNICQYMGELGAIFEVYRNDELTVEEIRMKKPRGILISPGPGTPCDSGISLQAVLELGPSIPLLGVCMGLQCIGEAFGGKIVRSPSGVMHGKSSFVFYDERGDGLFLGLPNPFTAGRYHSLVIERGTFPSEELEITAWTEDGLVMAARHKNYRHIQGVQFHPESIITVEGKKIINNFINFIKSMDSSSCTSAS